jgi:hypothetical protein
LGGLRPPHPHSRFLALPRSSYGAARGRNRTLVSYGAQGQVVKTQTPERSCFYWQDFLMVITYYKRLCCCNRAQLYNCNSLKIK